MNAAPFHLAGEMLMLDPSGVLFWPAARLLAVADLHLEKGTACARRGALVPPWDSRLTLDRLLAAIAHWRPDIVVALGDSFHDRFGSQRLPPVQAARLRRIGSQARLVWVLGNHDPQAPAGLAGEHTTEFRMGPLRFRHEATGGLPSGTGELCGHHHPKARIATRGGSVSRACFVADGHRIILPAFGAYTGGLDVTSPAIVRLFPHGGRAFLLGRDRLFSFELGQRHPSPVSAGDSEADRRSATPAGCEVNRSQ